MQSFSCDTDVYYDNDTLYIDIDNRTSVVVENISESQAIKIAKTLLEKWDFSYTLEFENYDEYLSFIN